MTLEDIIKVLPLVAFLVLQGIEEALAENCGNDIHCFSPYTCCANVKSCCYDRDAQDNFRRSYKLHIWNMWYFWFVIIFIMMSCFGGCGYYRRRRMATLHQQRQRAPITTRRTNHIRGSSTRNSQSYLAYVGPAASDPPEISFLPPPYSEVSSHPGMYPENKADLPPQYSLIASNYAGSPSPPMALNAQDLAAGTNNMPKPPPYCEVAAPANNPAPSLAEASAAPTNQDTYQTQPTCENSSTNQCSSQPSANDSTAN
ncbi:uncharacterized protein [Haliotis cracherodii]|uniref:uncharacterized protein n=1 Tax=Haliotis cracherodii TaxID=6455 RepID=UPI0039ECF4A5